MTCPRKVKVGAQFYRISRRKNPRLQRDTWGLCDHERCEIWIAPGLSGRRYVEVLWHEIIHAIHYNAGLSDDSTEEEFTDRGGMGLMMVMADNPALSMWTLKALAD